MDHIKRNKLRDFYILWSTQSLSQLGSGITAFALTVWLYDKTGSSLSTAALRICSYLPYVLMSIFAGALTDRWNKKLTMLVFDTLAALTTITVFILYKTDSLAVWHLYALNAVSGLMNTVQQPASEVANTILIPKEYYQKTSGLRSFSRSLISIFTPLIAPALYVLFGLEVVVAVDLFTFAVAFFALAVFIRLPETGSKKDESTLKMAKEGLGFLKRTPMILTLILFMAGVNFVASAFDAVLQGYVLPNPRGGKAVLGIVTSCAGIAMVLGSLLVSVLPKPKDRVKVVYITMLFSLGIENFMLAFCRLPVLWCLSQIIGWILVPVMSANLDIILRSTVPVDLQGRVYACRNTLQFFTIPIGLFWGGLMVDNVCEPFMAAHAGSSILTMLFGNGKGSGAALMMLILGVIGSTLCLVTGRRLKKYKFSDN